MLPLTASLSMNELLKDITNYLLSFESPALVIALISSFIAIGISKIVYVRLKWAIGLLIPFLLANLIYWTPVWQGEDASEYIAWAPLFISGWTLAGMSSTAVILFTIQLFRKQMNR